jgi:hypothetical protein
MHRLHGLAPDGNYYDKTQTTEGIRDGDLIHVPEHDEYGMMYGANPIAFDPNNNRSGFDTLKPGYEWHDLGAEYGPAYEKARQLMDAAGGSDPAAEVLEESDPTPQHFGSWRVV